MTPRRRKPGETAPDYGNSTLFSLEVHHGGFFCGLARNRAYIDKNVDMFDGYDSEEWSLLFLPDILKDLGYAHHSSVSWYWSIPGYTLADSLLPMKCDADIVKMINASEKHKILNVYIDHCNFIEKQRRQMDDLMVHGTVDEPPPVVHLGDEDVNLPEYHDDAANCSVEKDNSYAEDVDEEGSDSDIEVNFVDSDNDLGDQDDDLFDRNVDSDVDDVMLPKIAKDDTYVEMEDGVDTVVYEDLQLPDSDDEGKMKFNFEAFNSEIDMENPIFKVGMKFATIKEVRKSIKNYSIKNKCPIEKDRDDGKRIWAHCTESCTWRFKCGFDSRAKCYVVKEYNAKHNCANHWNVKPLTAKYLAKKYLEFFRDDEKMSLKAFAKIVQRELKMCPSRSKLGRARCLALHEIHGDENSQYNQLREYGQELRRSNPGSTFYVTIKADGTFSTLYFALDACKRGFLKGCRPILCFDGCHIKTKHGGQLLTAVSIDPNDCIFPVAMAIVETESTMSWEWFLTTLRNDLHIQNTAPYTIMSDKQKGLINAVAAVFPSSEHRFCVRHLYQNFHGSHKGEGLKNRLWACARSTHVPAFIENMEKLKADSPSAHTWLAELDPRTWVKAYFNEFPKCDILLNNSCEVFNKYILEARELPVLSMIDKIRCQLMTRIYNKQKETQEKWHGILCPKINKKLQKNIEWSNKIHEIHPAGHKVFSVKGTTRTHIVDLNGRTCDCRRWQLSGIPCAHAIACFREERLQPESMVAGCYHISTFLLAYGSNIMPVRDKSRWDPVHGVTIEILPPIYKKKVGRPPTRNRKKHPVEKEGKLTRHGVTMHCSYCSGPDHMKNNCIRLKLGIPPPKTKKRKRAALEPEDDANYGDQELLREIMPEEPGHVDPTVDDDNLVANMIEEEMVHAAYVVENAPLPDESAFVAEERENLPAQTSFTTASSAGRAGGRKRGRPRGSGRGSGRNAQPVAEHLNAERGTGGRGRPRGGGGRRGGRPGGYQGAGAALYYLAFGDGAPEIPNDGIDENKSLLRYKSHKTHHLQHSSKTFKSSFRNVIDKLFSF